MLISNDRSFVISSLGWVERGSLWVYRAETESAQTIRLSSAGYLSLHEGVDDHVAIVHNFDDGNVDMTVHRFPEIGTILGRIAVRSGRAEPVGSWEAWHHVPRHYTAFLQTPDWSDFGLITLDPESGAVALRNFPWFDDQHYDKVYQGIGGVKEIPGSDHVLVSVQRSSTLVIHDPVAGRKVGEVELGRRGGNSHLRFRNAGKELWADDYDTLLRLDPSTWRILDSRHLQDAASGIGQFIGAFTMDPGEEICAVARPFSSDVVAIDATTFKPEWTCTLGYQPLEAAILNGNRVVARDWKTGATLHAR